MVESITELRKICQPAEIVDNNAWYARIFARKISIYFTKLLLYTQISANQATFLFVLIGIISGMIFWRGTPLANLLGIILLQLWYIFDHVDGEIARYRKQVSITGAYLDGIAHYICHPFFFLSLSIGAFNYLNDVWALYLGMFGAFSSVLDLIVYDGYAEPILVRLEKLSDKEKNVISDSVLEGSVVKKKNILKMILGQINKIIFKMNRFYHALNVITLVVIINYFYPIILIGAFKLSPVYLLLLFYSITFSIDWISKMYITVRFESVDKKYQELTKRLLGK